jgi:hypothetical protein
VLWRSTATQEVAPDLVVAGARTPAAMPLPRCFAIRALCHFIQVRRQYITPIHRLGTLMRHGI